MSSLPTAQAAYEAAIRSDERQRMIAAIQAEDQDPFSEACGMSPMLLTPIGYDERKNGLQIPTQQPAPATGKALTTDADLRKELKLAKVKALRGKYKATPFVDVTPDDFLAYVRKHPGLRAEEVAKGLGAKKLPMVAIRNALGKKLKTKGARRGMRYWVR